jgi:hypothetical protein
MDVCGSSVSYGPCMTLCVEKYKNLTVVMTLTCTYCIIRSPKHH